MPTGSPTYRDYTNPRGAKGAQDAPAGIPTVPPLHAHNRQQLEPELEALAQWMDNVFHIPGVGIRFGLDALIGLIPGLGDTVTSLASLYILNAGRRYGVPRVTLVRMAMNIAVDYVCGAIPLVGDLFDVYWKANMKNVALLRKHVEVTPVEERRARAGDWLVVGALAFGLLALLVGCVTIAWWIIAALVHLAAHATT